MPPAAGLLPEFEGASMSRLPFELRNAGTWPQKMQSLSKHGCFAYLENLGSRGPRRGADRCRLAGFAATNGDRIASLSLLCPTALDPRAATPMAPRLLVIAGDRGAAAE